MINTAKEQAGNHRFKQYLSNPFRSFSYQNQDRYKMTIKQLIECTKDLARKVNRLLLSNTETKNVRQYLLELYKIYSSVKDDWEPDIIQKFEKLFHVNIPEHWSFGKEELFHFLFIHLKSNEQETNKILNFTQIIGTTFNARNVHVTDLSFKSFPLRSLELPKLLSHTWLKKCIYKSFISKNRENRLNALLVDYHSRNLTRYTSLYSIYHLLAFSNGTITFSYIDHLQENGGPSIYFTILQELYDQDEKHEDEILEDYTWEEPVIDKEDFPTEPLMEVSELLWLDSDFCHKKFFLNAFVEHYPKYEKDFHQRLAFSIIGKLLTEQADGEESVSENLFPLFPQWTNAHKKNLIDTSYVMGLRTYKSYQNIYYPKAMKHLQRLRSRYLVTKNWKVKYQYDQDTFKVDNHIKEFLENVDRKNVKASTGQHCIMCPFLHVCKEGEYAVDGFNG